LLRPEPAPRPRVPQAVAEQRPVAPVETVPARRPAAGELRSALHDGDATVRAELQLAKLWRPRSPPQAL